MHAKRPATRHAPWNLIAPLLTSLTLGLAATTTSLAEDPTTPAAEPPMNVIVILADDLGWGDLSCQGAQDLQTPHIDSLFSQGITFRNFYANCCVCSPTRASLLTGRYPELVGVPGVIRTHTDNNWGYLSPDARLLPQALNSAGYHTAIIGKWHLGLSPENSPNARGFDHFHGFLGDMMDDYYHHRRHDNNYMRLNDTVLDTAGTHATDLFTQWACDYIDQQADSESPFFMYLAYNAPHTPIQPPQDWLEKVKQRQPDATHKRAQLIALIEHMDAGIGKVLESLKSHGLSERTLIVFTSDNGGQVDVGANNGPWRDGKQSMYQGGLLVPATIVWPGVVNTPRSIDHPAITMDLFPTICEIAGADSGMVDGRSLVGRLTGTDDSTWERDLFFHRREGGNRYGGLIINAVIRGDWKLLQNSPFEPQELYHLGEDPGETRDRSAEPRFANPLRQALRRQVQAGGAIPWQPATEQESSTATQ